MRRHRAVPTAQKYMYFYSQKNKFQKKKGTHDGNHIERGLRGEIGFVHARCQRALRDGVIDTRGVLQPYLK